MYNKPDLKPCIYCDGKHRHNNCHTVKTTKQRKTILNQKQRGLNCLRSGHTKYQYRSRGRCLNCGLKHHTSICEPSKTSQDLNQKTAERQESSLQNSKDVRPASTTLATTTTTHTNALLQTAVFTASGPTTQRQARILIDTGSQKTFITQDLRNKLQLKPIQNETPDITTFGTTKSTTKMYEVVTFTLNAVNEDIKIMALVTPIICPPLSNNVQLTEIPPEFKALDIADSVEEKNDHNIDILIRNDHYAQVIVGNTKKSKDQRWMAIESKFGWLLSGPTPKMIQDKTFNTVCQIINAGPTKDDDLNETLEKFWEVSKVPEEFGEDDATGVQKHFQDTIIFNQDTNRYNVRLPWKDIKQNIPTNFTEAKIHLNSLLHTLQKKDSELIHKYNKQLLDQHKHGFIELVHDPNTHRGLMHYIPHFPVFKESSTTTMRIVYDASAKISKKALSLNDCLHTSPNMMQQLETMLLNFRKHNVADIEKAFLQIKLNIEDRDATRFLWLKDVTKSVYDPDNIVTCRFCCVLFGAAPSPYLLNATIQYHLAKQHYWVSTDLQKSIYMDNVLSGRDTEPEALEYYRSSRNYFKRASMNLRQWTSNSDMLNNQARSDGVNAALTIKVLGLVWNAETDTLSLSLAKLCEEISNTERFTKRSVLSLPSKLFDPLGFMEPVTAKAKIMMQKLWKTNTAWDDDILANHKENWTKWLHELKNLTSLVIPRRCSTARVL